LTLPPPTLSSGPFHTDFGGFAMRKLGGFACAAALMTAAAGLSQERVFKPVDTQALVVKPSAAAASLAAQSIQLAGNVAAARVDDSLYVRAVNFLFGSRQPAAGVPVQAGRSPIPVPGAYPQYDSPLKPVMPIGR
jgi:hypothetical protein